MGSGIWFVITELSVIYLVFNLVSVSFQSKFTHFSSVDCLVFIISIVSFTFVWGLTLGVLKDLTNSEKTFLTYFYVRPLSHL